jgi:hypothetical protein
MLQQKNTQSLVDIINNNCGFSRKPQAASRKP